MANFNNELRNFQVLPRDLIFDTTLSDRARFVYCYMAAKPDGWDFYQEPMARELGYSKKTLEKYMRELITRGWLVRGKQKLSDKKQFGSVEYTLKATLPCTNFYRTEESSVRNFFPNGSFSDTEKVTHIENRDYIENKENNIEERESQPKTKDAAKAATLARKDKFYDSLIPYIGKYPKNMIRAFFDYWSEMNKSETKMRFELQKTWQTSLRLATWASREKMASKSDAGMILKDNSTDKFNDEQGW